MKKTPIALLTAFLLTLLLAACGTSAQREYMDEVNTKAQRLNEGKVVVSETTAGTVTLQVATQEVVTVTGGTILSDTMDTMFDERVISIAIGECQIDFIITEYGEAAALVSPGSCDLDVIPVSTYTPDLSTPTPFPEVVVEAPKCELYLTFEFMKSNYKICDPFGDLTVVGGQALPFEAEDDSVLIQLYVNDRTVVLHRVDGTGLYLEHQGQVIEFTLAGEGADKVKVLSQKELVDYLREEMNK